MNMSFLNFLFQLILNAPERDFELNLVPECNYASKHKRAPAHERP